MNIGLAIMTGVIFLIGFAALAVWAAIHINRTDKHLDEESKKLREKRLTLEAEMEIAYWHNRRGND